MVFHLETERLILRDIRPTDLKGMFRLDSDPLVHRYLGKKPRTSINESEKDIATIINQYLTKLSTMIPPFYDNH